MAQTHRTVREISRETGIRLTCYEITTVSLVAAFLLEHSIICKMMQQIWTFEHLEVVRQHILRVVGNVIVINVSLKINKLSSSRKMKIGQDLTKLSSQ